METLEAGGMEAVEKKFVVRKVPPPFWSPRLDAAGVAAVREAVGATPEVFGALLGVPAKVVREWEQGAKAPAGPAARFLAEIRRDPTPWAARVREETAPRA